MILLSVDNDFNLKFYKDDGIVSVPDNTGYRHCDYIIGDGMDKMRDTLSDCDVWVKKQKSNINYTQNYLASRGLVIGQNYDIIDGIVTPIKSESVDVSLDLESVIDKNEFQKFVSHWTGLLDQPIPKIRRLSLDIEIEMDTKMPDPENPTKRVTAVGFEGSDGLKKVMVLDIGERGKSDMDIEPDFYDSEKEMLRDCFELVEQYPFLITFNGDKFDLPYLHNRAKMLGVKSPFIPLKNSFNTKNGIHLDIYRVFSNRSLQLYMYDNKYSDYSLNSISLAILGKQKLDVSFESSTIHEMAKYCQYDAYLTHELISYNNDMMFNILILLGRITKLPIDLISRSGINQWIKNMFYFFHIQRNEIIPTLENLNQKSTSASSEAIIEGKKYRGAEVLKPVPGIHFDVTVMDFASLYPSIIKSYNISYETVRCGHEKCKSNKIPLTNHWSCVKRTGLISLLIGSLKDLRVNYYKKHENKTISQVLKVLLNSTYGTIGFSEFPLFYLPVAESVTAIGRDIILKTVKHAEAQDIKVLAGDTDSCMLLHPTNDQIQKLIDVTKQDQKVDLEVDKEYRYLVLSDRKKNYFGVLRNGKMDIKGLVGKKSHTPPFIKKLFYGMIETLKTVNTTDDFDSVKKSITNDIRTTIQDVRENNIEMDDLAFSMVLNRDPEKYVKNEPQHIKVAKMIGGLKKGDVVKYIKTIGGVKPVSQTRKNDINSAKYIEFMKSVFDQIIVPLDLDFDYIHTGSKQISLDTF